MAPTIRELSRWLDANSEYYVTPEWATVVKHSVSTTCDRRLTKGGSSRLISVSGMCSNPL